MKFFKHISFLLLMLIAISSCSEYQKIIKSDDYEQKFQEANSQYDKKNYDRAIALYEQVYQRFPRTDQGQVAYFRMAKSYFELKDYFMAGYYFNQFSIRYPFSDNAEEATFLTAICSVKNSPAITLDQEETEIALNDLQQFVYRFPNSVLVDSCNRTMDRLRFKIETKRFNAVKLYSKMQENRAAVASSKSFIEEYPRSFYLSEVAVIQFENSYELAMNSILSKKKERIEDALETYSKYKHLFEEKKSTADKARKLQENLGEELLKVEEQYAYNEIVEAFQKSNSTSIQKKVRFLEETIARFNNFAEKYPNSGLVEKARGFHKRAEKELSNI